MSTRIIGHVKRVNGPVITVRDITDAEMMELVRIGEQQLIGEVVKLLDGEATIQVYEDATGVRPGDNVYGSNMPLCVELGPGIIGSIYDGIQRPLEKLEEASGTFIAKGLTFDGIDHKKLWHFQPNVKVGDKVSGGAVVGQVKESETIFHKVMIEPTVKSGVITQILKEGDYNVEKVVATVSHDQGDDSVVTMMHKWPIRNPRPVKKRLPFHAPLVTGLRVIDTLFPIAKGGTVAIPGGFGTGKTMTQHAIAQWCDADIIVYIGCGERGNEMTDVLREFPKLVDPKTGHSLMERTILIANTSNMPVSAREASIYTGITIAEYYRDMGYDVAIMADSTSRWAEALRELSGRMEEMPAEEGFPAYLATRIAEFYERAGLMTTLSDKQGSVSVIGAVSPPGGDFSEPVTMHTKRFVRCFWGLDRALASARHYPAISWTESYSEYIQDVRVWWNEKSDNKWQENRKEIMELLQKEERLQQIVKLVGADALPDSQNFILEVCTLFKNSFLQQNAFDKIDRYSVVEKQTKMLSCILTYWNKGLEAIHKGVPLVKLRRLRVVQDIAKIKFSISNDDVDEIDKLELRLERSIEKLGGVYEY